jgi:hypothetical protein
VDLGRLNLSSPGDGTVTRIITLDDALKNNDSNPLLRSNDILIVPADRSRERTMLYLQVGTFILSSVALGLLIKQQAK